MNEITIITVLHFDIPDLAFLCVPRSTSVSEDLYLGPQNRSHFLELVPVSLGSEGELGISALGEHSICLCS